MQKHRRSRSEGSSAQPSKLEEDARAPVRAVAAGAGTGSRARAPPTRLCRATATGGRRSQARVQADGRRHGRRIPRARRPTGGAGAPRGVVDADASANAAAGAATGAAEGPVAARAAAGRGRGRGGGCRTLHGTAVEFKLYREWQIKKTRCFQIIPIYNLRTQYSDSFYFTSTSSGRCEANQFDPFTGTKKKEGEQSDTSLHDTPSMYCVSSSTVDMTKLFWKLFFLFLVWSAATDIIRAAILVLCISGLKSPIRS